MSKFLKNCKEFMNDEEGLTVIEYVIGKGGIELYLLKIKNFIL